MEFVVSAALLGYELATVGIVDAALKRVGSPSLSYEAINAGALIQNLWWWWGIPTLLLGVIFIGLLLINLGLDEVSNPRLRKLSSRIGPF